VQAAVIVVVVVQALVHQVGRRVPEIRERLAQERLVRKSWPEKNQF
jgi:hypothetical protein